MPVASSRAKTLDGCSAAPLIVWLARGTRRGLSEGHKLRSGVLRYVLRVVQDLRPGIRPPS